MNTDEKIKYLSEQEQNIVLDLTDSLGMYIAIVEIENKFYIRNTVEGGAFITDNDQLLEFNSKQEAHKWIMSLVVKNKKKRKKSTNYNKKKGNRKKRNWKKEKRKKKLTKKMKRKRK